MQESFPHSHYYLSVWKVIYWFRHTWGGWIMCQIVHFCNPAQTSSHIIHAVASTFFSSVAYIHTFVGCCVRSNCNNWHWRVWWYKTVWKSFQTLGNPTFLLQKPPPPRTWISNYIPQDIVSSQSSIKSTTLTPWGPSCTFIYGLDFGVWCRYLGHW